MTRELTYTQIGEYLYPNLTLPETEEDAPMGKYGMLRETFLQKHHKGTYNSMLLTGRLTPHLREIDQQAEEQVDKIVSDLMKQNGVNEAMKARDQMGWVQAVNSFTAQAEEMVLAEIVYK